MLESWWLFWFSAESYHMPLTLLHARSSLCLLCAFYSLKEHQPLSFRRLFLASLPSLIYPDFLCIHGSDFLSIPSTSSLIYYFLSHISLIWIFYSKLYWSYSLFSSIYLLPIFEHLITIIVFNPRSIYLLKYLMYPPKFTIIPFFILGNKKYTITSKLMSDNSITLIASGMFIKYIISLNLYHITLYVLCLDIFICCITVCLKNIAVASRLGYKIVLLKRFAFAYKGWIRALATHIPLLQ